MHKSNAQEIRELRDISNSRAFQNLLKRRKDYLQKEANRFVREQNLIQAYGTISKLDDIEKLLQVIKKQIMELEKED